MLIESRTLCAYVDHLSAVVDIAIYAVTYLSREFEESAPLRLRGPVFALLILRR